MRLLSPNSGPHLTFWKMDVNSVDSISKWEIELFAVGVSALRRRKFWWFHVVVLQRTETYCNILDGVKSSFKMVKFLLQHFWCCSLLVSSCTSHNTIQSLNVAISFVEMLWAFDGTLRYNVVHSLNLIFTIVWLLCNNLFCNRMDMYQSNS